MINLPEKFIARMKNDLPQEEWGDFFAVYEQPPVKGLRVNALKISGELYEKISPFTLTRVSWAENAYYTEGEKLGAHPHHFAGLVYSQEPSATSAVPFLQIQKGEKVLDLCSAPGGKGTQAAAYLQGEGLVVLNEPIFSRAQILSSNVERMGVKNAVVLNEYPEKLSSFFGAYFDKIIIDAPCSGEGMFRKNEKEAVAEWSEENVALCVARQREILNEGTKMLKVGGRLVYSTCTFSVGEDEGQVRDYLQNHSEMKLVTMEKLFPHKIKGEGHFVAVFEKIAGENDAFVKEMRAKISPASEKIYRAFERDFFKTEKFENLYEANGTLYALPKTVFDWKRLKLLRAGVKLGEIKNGRFEPSHSLAMCVKKEECKRSIDYPSSDINLDKFLRGETVECETAENGWLVVCADGYPVGLGKAVNGTVKNHIPKGLRKMGD